MYRYFSLISLLILSGCAGSKNLETPLRDNASVIAEDKKISTMTESWNPGLNPSDNIENDSKETGNLPLFLKDARARYNLALKALEQADTTAARAGVHEVLSLLIDNSIQDTTQNQPDLVNLLSNLIERIRTKQDDNVDMKGAIPRTLNRSVEQQIKIHLKNPDFLLASYQRSGRYTTMIREKLRTSGLPQELQWLPIVESGFKTRAYSRASAAGIWQFIYETGRRYGLDRSGWIDHRMDPYKATTAALGYLTDLHKMFDDWFLALAAYNCGEMRVLREINRTGSRSFWKLRLPRETRQYIPKFLAVLHILENPDKYGIKLPEPFPPYLFEEVHLKKSVTLKNLAEHLKMSQDELKAMNSSIRYGVTPPSGYSVRVPLGAGLTILSNLDKIPESSFKPPPEVGKYRVRRGDTLGHIARRFRTSVSSLRRMNRIRGSLIRIGQVLRVPGRNYRTFGTSNFVRINTEATTHSVRRGDTLTRIARNYGTTIAILKQRNNLKGNTIYPRQVLHLDRPGKSIDGSVGTNNLATYNIRSGDTLARIARIFKVSLSALIKANPNLQARRLQIGQQVIIPG